MQVFDRERADGLERAIASTRVLAYVSPAKILSFPPTLCVPEKVIATNRGQPDLHYLETVLVSTGWNANDDVFDRAEVWAARRTPEDKPFNYEHNGDDIIGHITSNKVVADGGESVPEDAPSAELPDKFHVVTSAVLYRYWEKADLQERMDRVIAEVGEGKWFVSMECFFRSFDYAMTDLASGQKKVIARNDQTSFLTKHLRAYGGDGVFQQYRVGRLLKEIVFSGKGLVRQPANPDSVILGQSAAFAWAEESKEFFVSDPSKYSEQIDALRKENESLKATIATSDLDKVKADAKALADSLSTLQKDCESYKKNIETLQASLKESEGREQALAQERDSLKAEGEKAALEAARLARVTKAREKLGIEEADATKLVETLKGTSDEAFDLNLSIIASTAEKKAAAVTLSTVPNLSGLPAPMGGDPKKVGQVGGTGGAPPIAPVNIQQGVNATLDAAQPNAQPAMAAQVDAKADQLFKDVAGFFGLPQE